MTRVVLDTNVVVSAHLKAGGPEDQILKRVFDRNLTICISDPILSEYERVLKYPRLPTISKALLQTKPVVSDGLFCWPMKGLIGFDRVEGHGLCKAYAK